MRSCWGLVFTTSAEGPAAWEAAVFSISLELVQALRASAAAPARARALTATRGPRRERVVTGRSLLLCGRTGVRHRRVARPAPSGCPGVGGYRTRARKA